MFDLQGYGELVLKGFGLTVAVALLSLAISTLLGMIGAVAKLSKSRVARTIAGVYTTIIRGVPDLVLMLLIFFGGQMLVNDIGDWMGWEYIDISPFIAGTLTIGFIFGAYMTETFRGAILAVPRGEIEAGHAYGMTGPQTFFRITLPAMVRHALPSFGNNWLVLAKTTALVSVIGLHDMVYNAGAAGFTVKKPFTFYLLAAGLFLVITATSDIALRWTNKRYSSGVRKA
ncbi:MAG: ABC transporter permease [Rhodospirillales bacterium]|nr:ABC transporter permease [Rhodospirillales bacterium]MDH3913639.1 ABC transporter permease [Rhodospirillales bacterium]MDH3920735.1 ABC transporter permease [Rhodospirillales bacterium]MDH3969916.1 ABC transporter permease [Rhodospirillales bacterium]